MAQKEDISDEKPIEKLQWSIIQRKLDQLKDIDEIFYFLRDVVYELDVCDKGTCPVFPNLFVLDKMRLDYEYKTMKEAKKELITNKPQLQKYKDQFIEYLVKSKQIMAEVYALKVNKDTQLSNYERIHAGKIEMMKIGERSGHLEKEFQNDLNGYVELTEEEENKWNEDPSFKHAKAKMKKQAK